MLSQDMISQRANEDNSFPDDLLFYEHKAKENLYDPQTNKEGIVDIGLAENKICEDLMQQKLTELLPKKVTLDQLHYFKNYGSDCFRKALSNFLNKFFKPLHKISEDDLVVVTGVTCFLDLVAFGLVDEGEYFLCPAPYYSRFRNDLYEKSRARTYDVDVRREDGPGYLITLKNLQRAYNEAVLDDLKIKAIIVANPNNPTGDILSKEEIRTILNFAKEHKIHAVFDEIYGLSVHQDGYDFHSVCSVENPIPEMTHFMWGVSKDLGLSGFRCGVLHSKNSQLLKFVQRVAFFSAIPLFIQDWLTSLLKDTNWFEKEYFPKVHKQMKIQYGIATKRLENLGVRIHKSGGGDFIWANFSKFMKDNTKDAEKDLFEHFFSHKVFFAGGTTFYSKEPGWFRIIFTRNMDILTAGLDRIEEAINALPYLGD